MLAWLPVTHIMASFFMLGVIWYVQLVHYPLMSFVVRSRYPEYQKRHELLTSFVVMPLMIIELLTGIVWTIVADYDVRLLVNLALMAVIWWSTLLLQMPCHRALQNGFDEGIHRRLVASNWIRTASWTLRGGLLALMSARILEAGN